MARRLIDNYDLFRANEDRLLDQIKNNPVCDECGEIITDEFFYDIYGHNICIDCMNGHREEVI